MSPRWDDMSPEAQPRETYRPSGGTFDMSPDIEGDIFYLTPKVPAHAMIMIKYQTALPDGPPAMKNLENLFLLKMHLLLQNAKK